MESYAFSHNDEQYRISADRHGEYLKLCNPDGTDFIPPPENRYDQILRVKFGLGQESFELLRQDRLTNWKITELTLYGAALSIRHTTIYDKPVLKNGTTRTFHGVRAEQLFTETIPYDNISPVSFTVIAKLLDASNDVKASWRITVSAKKVVAKTPSGMEYEIPRNHL